MSGLAAPRAQVASATQASGGTAGRRAVVAVQCQHGATRRQLLASTAGVAAVQLLGSRAALAASLPPQEFKKLCDDECSAKLDAVEAVTLPSGLQYKDIVVGKGPEPIVGFQVVCNYIAMTPALRIFDSSLEKGKPYDIRIGAGQVIKGLDEGILGMRPGGLRRLYIPGDMAFPNGLRAAAGRPSVPANSPVVFDVQLLYTPGLEDDE